MEFNLQHSYFLFDKDYKLINQWYEKLSLKAKKSVNQLLTFSVQEAWKITQKFTTILFTECNGLLQKDFLNINFF